MANKKKRVTLKEKVQVYENLLHRLHAIQLSGNELVFRELLQRISDWSYAHRVGNGEYTSTEQQAIIDRAFWGLEE